MTSRAQAGCGGARGAAALHAETGGVKWGQWHAVGPGAPDHQHRARHVDTGIRGCSYARVYLQARSPGLRRAKGPRVCGRRGNCGADAGAGRCWPAGHGAGGGVAAQADRRGLGLSAWAPP
jgi:hypothetical protein